MGFAWKNEQDWGGVAKAFALLLPLVLVFLAGLFAATPEKYRLSSLSLFVANYPVRIELAEAEAATRQRDEANRRSQRDATLARLQAEQEAGETATRAEIDALFIEEKEAGIADSNSVSGEALDAAPIVLPDANGPLEAATNDLLPIQFDLAGGPAAPGTFQITKEVQFGSDFLGQMRIRVDATSIVYVSREDIIRTLPIPEKTARRLQGDYIRLPSLREEGIDLRYDPIGDRLVFNGSTDIVMPD